MRTNDKEGGLQPTPEIKGWCPGAYAPMQSGDGLLIRAKAIGSRVSAAQAREIARIAQSCGNGLIDLSQRAQLQLRGISEATLAEALRRLDAIGMLAPDADAERVTNIMAAPLAGLDPDAAFDANELAASLAAALQADSALRALPAKFLFLIDDGGALALSGADADIRIEATRDGRAAIRIAGAPNQAAIVEKDEAISAALRLARAFVELRARHEFAFKRVGPLVAELGAAALPRAADLFLSPYADARASSTRAHIFGAQRRGALCYAGISAPFGRWRARELAAVAALAIDKGLNELRLTPWRALLILTPSEDVAQSVVASLQGQDFITSADDERLAVIACPGAPECPQALGETRAYVARLAPLAQKLIGVDGVGLHISGCAKGCARPSATPITLVPGAHGFDFIENGAAGDAPLLKPLTIEAVVRELSARTLGIAP